MIRGRGMELELRYILPPASSGRPKNRLGKKKTKKQEYFLDEYAHKPFLWYGFTRIFQTLI